MDTNENTRPAPRSRVPAPVDGPAVNTDPRPPTPAGTAANVVRGGLIGLAETIPGVSGGTVALVTGIYERLIASAKNITELPKDAVTKGDWRATARKIDWWLGGRYRRGALELGVAYADSHRAFAAHSGSTLLASLGIVF